MSGSSHACLDLQFTLTLTSTSEAENRRETRRQLCCARSEAAGSRLEAKSCSCLGRLPCHAMNDFSAGGGRGVV